nr:pseudouridine-metabolizing bifunctional protein C1861.05-like isoform X3 [Zootoca vivipara]
MRGSRSKHSLLRVLCNLDDDWLFHTGLVWWYNCGWNHDCGTQSKDPCICNRRNWRGSPRRREDFGCECGPDRIRSHSSCCDFRRCEVYTGYWQDIGVSGNSRCLCGHLWRLQRVPSLLLPSERLPGPISCAERGGCCTADWSLNLQLGSGVLIAVPCPEDQAASGQLIEEAIQQALREAREKGITGKELTPVLLQKLNKLTSGESLRSNIALIKNNAKVGSRIAVALNKIQRFPGWRNNSPQDENLSPAPRPVVIGAINVDFIAKARDATIVGGGQTNPSIVRQSFGGVGRNLADCLSRLGKTPFFISVMGKDEHSESVLRYCKHMDMRGVLRLEGHNTATYCSVFTGSGELSLGLGDMEIHQQITEQYVSKFKETLCSAPLVCIDGNVPLSTIQYVCQIAREHNLAVCYEPTDVDKASKPFLSESWRALACISPNLRELRAINRTLGHPVPADLPSTLEDAVKTAVTLAQPLLGELHCLVVTLGQHGVLVCSQNMNGRSSLLPGIFNKATAAEELCAVHYPAIPVPAEEIVNVSGAGDSLMAGILAGLLAGEDMDDCVRMGLLSASFSLRSYEPVSPDISATSVNVARLKAQQWPVAKRWKLT